MVGLFVGVAGSANVAEIAARDTVGRGADVGVVSADEHAERMIAPNATRNLNFNLAPMVSFYHKRKKHGREQHDDPAPHRPTELCQTVRCALVVERAGRVKLNGIKSARRIRESSWDWHVTGRTIHLAKGVRESKVATPTHGLAERNGDNRRIVGAADERDRCVIRAER